MWVQLAFRFEAASFRGHILHDLLQIQLYFYSISLLLPLNLKFRVKETAAFYCLKNENPTFGKAEHFM